MLLSAVLPDGPYLEILFILFIASLLVTCGDIETNTGPVTDHSYSVDSDCASPTSSQLHSLLESALCTIGHLNVRSLLMGLSHERIFRRIIRLMSCFSNTPRSLYTSFVYVPNTLAYALTTSHTAKLQEDFRVLKIFRRMKAYDSHVLHTVVISVR